MHPMNPLGNAHQLGVLALVVSSFRLDAE